jgi:DNA mismatch repair protein MutL
MNQPTSSSATGSNDGLAKIRILPDHVVSRIAAGEVVERPAAVVKELIDNSLDARSTRILIEVADGGRSLIRVTDDGEGMDRTDAALAFERHATSKLQSERDLFAVRTMGFRGEALPSIASVSKVRLITARGQDAVGTQLWLTGGTVTKTEEAAAAPGTQIEVMELFFNTPARKKFLKAVSTEFSHISQVVQRAALAWPQVQFGLRHNGQVVSEYPAVGGQKDRVYQIYGSRHAGSMVALQLDRPGCRLQGFTVKAEETRSSRSPQEVFVNGRAVKNVTVAHAVYDGYGPSLAKGRHPVYVLFLDVDPDRVDVNVHPAKREVRFADQDLIHQMVRQAIREALGTPGSSMRPESPVHAFAIGWSGQSQRSAEIRPAGELGMRPGPGMVSGRESLGAATTVARETTVDYMVTEPEVVPLGQVGQTFLVAQVGSELHVIDQHTAHERVLFERLRRAWVDHKVMVQPLLIPEPFDLPMDRATLLQGALEELSKLGLEIEPFGSGTFVIRGVPAQLGPIDYPAFIDDVLEDLAQWGSASSTTEPSSMADRLRPVLASLACHGAVRAGRAMALPEIKHLILDWLAEGLPMTCPHGRRVALRLPAEELAKIFGRV